MRQFLLLLTLSLTGWQANLYAGASIIPGDSTDLIVVPGKQNQAVFPGFISTYDHDKCVDYVQQFCKNRTNYLVSSYKRSRKFFPKAATILKKYKVPEVFTALLTLESDCNPNVVSYAGAVGYWQFIDAVAGEYGLQYVHQLTKADKEKLKKENPKQADSIIRAVTKKRDDRKNFYKSTNAAARYLRDRMRDLSGDILLVAASYNCGIGNVRNAMFKSGETNPSFWDIKNYLPRETQHYVMNFIAVNVAFTNIQSVSNKTIAFEKNVDQPVEPADADINCEPSKPAGK